MSSDDIAKGVKQTTGTAPVLLTIRSAHNPEWLKRPARQQTKEIKRYTPNSTGDYNIWYHKFNGVQYNERPTFAPGEERFRCVPERDTGKTRAKKSAPICSHFAAGRCVNGHKCNFRHQIPTAMDERKLTVTHDVFGRERHAADKNDMGGNGSFSRNNRTLYIGNLNMLYPTQAENEAMLRRHFEAFGELEYVRVISGKNCGFVRYIYRACAEFAKLAMADGYLDNGDEVINIRWAHADPNPLARQHEERQQQLEFINAVQAKIQSIPADQMDKKRSILTLQALQRGQYPDTNASYQQAQITAAASNGANNTSSSTSSSSATPAVPSIGPTMPPSKRVKTTAAATSASSGAGAGAGAVVPASTDTSAARWQSLTPAQQQAAWAQYYRQTGGAGHVSQQAVQAAIKATEEVKAETDDRPTFVAEAYYNPQSGGFFMPNPNTNEAHPYAVGKYRKDAAGQAAYQAMIKGQEERRTARMAKDGTLPPTDPTTNTNTTTTTTQQ
mmetsp:Transcript_12019/g.20073  ORF Transcript_12019/g.20073 Transcript_12019/m.20073 type:complete len:500 (+) Transcript_12019:97-1596(+)